MLQSSHIKHIARKLGFDACGIATARRVDDDATEHYQAWLSQGKNGCMDWAARNGDVRENPELLLDGARSVIVVAMNYYPQVFQPSTAAQVAYYAYGRDYHEVIKKRLWEMAQIIEQETGAQSRACVDSAPLRERYWAQRAGVGFTGLNNQLIIPGKGSFFFLGVLLTTLELEPDELFKKCALENGVPLLMTRNATSNFMSEIIRWLNVRLAPCITIHGVLIDVYGVGVLITGESGIGKSEMALELIKRGHRLVSDDVVEIRKVSEETLIGTAPEITKHLIELRGIGIIDVKTLFGVSSVRNSQNIDLVIELEEWSKDKDFDRLGLEEHYIEYLGNRVVCHKIPIRPGRNLAIICEAAAVNHRQKLMGYNAAQELYKRVQANLMGGYRTDEDE